MSYLSFQQLSCPAPDHFLNEFQPFRGKIVSGMPLEPESQQMPERSPVFLGHYFFCRLKEIIVHTGNHRFGIGLQVFQRCQRIPACEVEQRIAVVKERRRGHDLVGFVVHQEAEVSEMPVGVADHRIKNQHTVGGAMLIRN